MSAASANAGAVSDMTSIPWDMIVFGNTLQEYLSAVLWFVVYLLVFGILYRIVLSRLGKMARKTTTKFDDVAVAVLRSVKPPFYAYLAFYLALRVLMLPKLLEEGIAAVLWVWVIYQCVVIANILIEYAVTRRVQGANASQARTAAHFLSTLLKITAWAIGLLLVLSNLGVNITSLVAGLGIGGVAVAFALQNILADLFSSFAIYFDKPFSVGDFIIVGDKMGTVDRVGIKTTRIKALSGEELVFSNRELTSATIQNYKKMQERRVVFRFGIVYESADDAMTAIPGIVKRSIESAPDTRFDRSHFFQFGASSLDFETVYFVLSPDYNHYMDINQGILLSIRKEFAQRKISMAYPTQTIYVSK